MNNRIEIENENKAYRLCNRLLRENNLFAIEYMDIQKIESNIYLLTVNVGNYLNKSEAINKLKINIAD